MSIFCAWTGICAEPEACRTVSHLGADYSVCSYQTADVMVRTHRVDENDRPYRRLSRLERSLTEPPLMLMNGGMYQDDLTAVGLYVENGVKQQHLSTKDGWGNFHLLPNGVFWGKGGKVHVTETGAYQRINPAPDFATQSGPMLVIEGKLHPRFIPGSDSLKIRNGVGVSADGSTVHFAMSHGRVNFHDFGTLFRDELEAPNALFLDGTVSEMRAQGLNRGSSWRYLGPMISVTKRP
jgi:uncharacterized protein YigE (DUF2233 family)